MTTILLTDILIGDRGRKNYGDLSGIKTSIATIGSIHPITLSLRPDGKYDLVAGGRRFAAMKELGTTELHQGSVLDKDALGFNFKEDVEEELRKEAELDENLYRLKPKWFEDVVLIADVHTLKRDREGRKWGLRQTAELLGPGYGLANVSYAIRLAKLIREQDADVLDCDSMSDAISLLVKRKEDEALAELQKRAAPAAMKSMGSFLDTLNISLTKKKVIGGDALSKLVTQQDVTVQSVEDVSTDGSPVQPGSPVEIPLSKMFVLGDAIATMTSMPESCIDHVVTDIPYGIEMDNLDTNKNIGDVEAEHDVKANVDLMKPFLEQSFRLVKSGGFCVFFYDLDWHEYLQSCAELIGWKIQRWPLVIHKTSSCQNNAAQYNTTKNYEVVMVLRRDEKTVLRSQQATSVWTGDFAAERRLYNHPFWKPFDLYKWIYTMIAFQGQSTLDPFCGEMSACRAAANCGLVPFGIEIKDQHYNRGIEHMKAVYALIHKSNCIFT